MTEKDFDEFVKSQIRDSPSSDWYYKEKDEWLGYLKKLYEQIEEFLKTYIEKGSIQINYKPIDLNEENVGTYSTKTMIIRIGRQEVTLTPIGTFLIGAKGGLTLMVLLEKLGFFWLMKQNWDQQ